MSGEEKIVSKDVNIAKMVEPKFLTLTRKPANQIAFKIVRKDGEVRMRRVNPLKRSVNPSLAILFPSDMTEDEVKSMMSEYGFSDYTLVSEGEGDDKKWKAYRSDIKPEDMGEKNTVTVGVGGGVKLIIERKHTANTPELSGIRLCSLEFSTEEFADKEAVKAWFQRNSVDFHEDRLENSDTSVLYRRAEVPEKAEVGKVEIEAGVIGHVVRQEGMDIPPSMVEVINEAAYGSWGWGQLDFGAFLADVEFTEATRDAVEVLYRVLDDILFYSYLPLTVRKELVARATSQFTSYVIELMDALPPKTVMINRSMKEKDMTTKQTPEEIKRAEDEAKAKAEAEAKTKAEADAKAKGEQPVTRAEVTQIVTDAINAAFEANKPKTEPAKGEGEGGKADASDPNKGAVEVMRSSLETITEGMKAVSSAVTALSESNKAIGDRIAALEGSTTLRSDDKDGKPAQSADVFKGMFGRKSGA